jgi:hypothetical protein
MCEADGLASVILSDSLQQSAVTTWRTRELLNAKSTLAPFTRGSELVCSVVDGMQIRNCPEVKIL